MMRCVRQALLSPWFRRPLLFGNEQWLPPCALQCLGRHQLWLLNTCAATQQQRQQSNAAAAAAAAAASRGGVAALTRGRSRGSNSGILLQAAIARLQAAEQQQQQPSLEAEAQTQTHGQAAAGAAARQQHGSSGVALQRALQQLLADAPGQAAVTALLCDFACTGEAVPREQVLALLQQASAAPQACSTRDLAALWRSAAAAGVALDTLPRGVVRPLLLRAVALLLAERPAGPHPTAVAAELARFEAAGESVPPLQMQQLLQHMLANAARVPTAAVVRLLRSASFTGLQLQRSADVGPLVLQLLVPGAAAALPLHTLAGALRALSILQPRLPGSAVQQLVQLALDHPQWRQQQQQQCAPEPQAHAADITGSSIGIGSSSSDSSGGGGSLPAADIASMVLKAVICMGHQLPPQQLQPLLQSLADGVLQQRRLHLLPSLLVALVRYDQAGLPDEQLRRLLQLAGRTLLQEAAATAGSSGRMPAEQQQTQQQQQQMQQQLSASALAYLVRAMGQLAVPLPAGALSKVVPLFLDRQPGPRDVCNMLAALGCMRARVSDGQMQQLLRALLPAVQAHGGQQQPAQQQQQQQAVAAPDVGNALWGIASLGYALPAPAAEALLRQQLCQLRPAASFCLAQSLWALAWMGLSEGPAGGAARSSDGQQLPAALLQQLLDAVVRDQEQYNDASNASAVRGGAAAEAAVGGGGSRPWHLSVAAWAAAMCDMRACRPQVLRLCAWLAAPAAWARLRQSELVQLSLVHLWLCEYEWSDSGGLAAWFSAAQMDQLRLLRQQQVSHATRGISIEQQQQQQAQGHGSSTADAAAWQVGFEPGCTAAASWAGGLEQQQRAPAAQQQGLPVGPSATQRQLYRLLRGMRGVAGARLEEITPDGLFAVDVAVRTDCGRLLAVEFDGPFHYAVVAAAGGGSGGSGRGRKQPPAASRLLRTRTTVFRDRALVARGYTLVSVPFYEWPANSMRRQQYLAARVAAALGGGGDGGGGN